jgi:hypothetical protein
MRDPDGYLIEVSRVIRKSRSTRSRTTVYPATDTIVQLFKAHPSALMTQAFLEEKYVKQHSGNRH